MSEEQKLEKEVQALDAIENLLEYAKGDIIAQEFTEVVDKFQADLIMHRSEIIDLHQELSNRQAVQIAESTPGGSGANNSASDQ